MRHGKHPWNWRTGGFLASLIFCLVCVSAGIVLATLASGNVILTTDSSAPISQLLLLDQGRVGSLLELRLARIPSFFPDLLGLWILIKLGGSAAPIGLLQAKYAIVFSSLLVGLQAWIIARGTGLRRWPALLCSLSGTLFLFHVSPLYREAIGLTLSPVHHGGNLVNTMIMIGLLAEISNGRPLREHWREWCLLILLAGVGTLSNNLFLFTAVVPIWTSLSALFLSPAGWLGQWRFGATGSLSVKSAEVWLEAKVERLILAAIPVAALIGWISGRFFNLQCTLAFTTFPASNLLVDYHDSPVFLLATALALLLLVSSLRSWLATNRLRCSRLFSPMEGAEEYTFGWIRQDIRWPIQLVISLAALSPYFYTLFHPKTPARYLLTPLMLLVVMLPLVISRVLSLPRHHIGASVGPGTIPRTERQGPLRHLLAILLLLLVSAPWIDHSAAVLARNYYHTHVPLGDRQVAELLLRLGHTTGLSDFWGANLGAISNGALDVQPIARDGEPDLWAHNREAYLADGEGGQAGYGSAHRNPTGSERAQPPVKDYSFVYLQRDGDWELDQDQIISAYGEPASRLGCNRNDGDHCILLYADSSRIQEVIAAKLARFKNRCIPRRNVR